MKTPAAVSYPSDIAFTPTVNAIQSRKGSRQSDFEQGRARVVGDAHHAQNLVRRTKGEKQMKIAESIRELIAKGPLAHLTTLNSTGGPQVTVIWVGVENEEFVIGHLALHQKVKNIRRDSRVALSLLGDKTNAQGLREYPGNIWQRARD
jgi:predicted pyridoxine 5'-phosphate oxidase superfamily flavin-nucleotide-binding protein